MSTVEQRSRQLDPGALITLYQLDLTKKGGPILHFHDGIAVNDAVFNDCVVTDPPHTHTLTSALADFTAVDVGLPIKCDAFPEGSFIQNVVNEHQITVNSLSISGGTGLRLSIPRYQFVTFNGVRYTPFPIRAEGFEWSTKGVLPRPTLSVSNIGSICSSLLRQYDDFTGCKLTRLRTFEAFLATGAEPSAQAFPVELFQVERKTVENNTVCSFELSMPADAEGVTLPRRQVLAHQCVWLYRGPDCQYAGAVKTNRLGQAFGGTPNNRGLYNPNTHYVFNDLVFTNVTQPDGTIVKMWWVKRNNVPPPIPLNDTGGNWWLDTCLKKQSDCELHFGANQPLPTSAFPGCYKLT